MGSFSDIIQKVLIEKGSVGNPSCGSFNWQGGKATSRKLFAHCKIGARGDLSDREREPLAEASLEGEGAASSNLSGAQRCPPPS